MKTHIIYVSGLGDRYDRFRAKHLKRWDNRLGVRVTFVPMTWRHKSETAQQKLARVQEAIKAHPDHRVVLVGESAGASVVLAATQTVSVAKVIGLCGKMVRADRVSPYLYSANPAFESMMRLADEAAAARTASSVPVVGLRAFFDHIVRPTDMKVRASVIKRIPTVGHFFGISSVLVLLWPLLVREATRD